MANMEGFLKGLVPLLLCMGLAHADSPTLKPTDSFGARGSATAAPLSLSRWDHAFFRFDLRTLSGDIEQATLRLHPLSSQNLETLVWSAGSDNWNESGSKPANVGYSWSNSPLATATHSAAGYVEFDVTSFIREQYTDDGLASFEVSNSSGTWHKYGSRLGATPPQLLIRTTNAPSTDNTAPIAVIDASPENGKAPLNVNFSGSTSTDSDGTISSYLWEFGNGQNSSGITANYTFEQAGEYSVKLTVSDNQGLIGTHTKTISVSPADANLPPKADFSSSATSSQIGKRISFDAAASTDPEASNLTFSWDFGEGSQASGSIVDHVYSTAGNHTVTLTVTDTGGLTDTISQAITISQQGGSSGDLQTVTLNPTDDVGATNKGSTSPLRLSHWEHAFFKFPLASITGEITSATVRLYSAENSTISTEVRLAASDNWNENNGRPAKSDYQWSSSPFCSVPNEGNQGYIECDVTQIVKTEASGDQIISFEVSSDNGGWKRYGSKEGQNKPELVVTTAGSGTPPANQNPQAAFTATPQSGTAPLVVNVDASSSSDSDGNVQSYHWNFGDGSTTTGATASHEYASQGTYTLSLTVADNDGATDSSTTSIAVVASAANVPPVASLSASPISGIAPLTVTFNSSNSTDPDGSITSYQWNFGDNSSDTSPSPSHLFTSAGEYTVSLTVIDNESETHTTTQVIEVVEATQNQPPTAEFSLSTDSVSVGEAITLNAAMSNDDQGIVAYNWSFGDGTSGVGLQTTKSYSADGNFTITLTVIDTHNAESSVSKIVKVSAPPSGGETTLQPSDDIAASDKGGDPTLQISYWDHAYLRFPLNTVSGTIESAIFRLYYTQPNAPETVVWPADSDQWTESTNSPNRTGFDYMNTELCTMNSSATPGYLECDLTPFIQQEAAGDGIASLEISNDSGGWKSYTSKDGAFPPELIINSSGGTPSTPNNATPTAIIQLNQILGTVPFDVSFDGSGSFDGDGTISSYQWKLDGTTVSANQTGSATIRTAGSHTLSLVVTDNNGATSIASKTITASGSTNTGQCPTENLVYNGDFQIQKSGSISAGQDMGGWTSEHGYLGIDVFLSNDTVGIMNNGIDFDLVKQQSFPGDAQHNVPATNALLFSDGGPGNPNGSTVWKQTVTGLQSGQSYAFSAYVGNALVPNWGGEPIAVMKVNGQEKVRMEVPHKGGDLNWTRLETQFVANGSSAVLEIHDVQTSTLDDFTVTAIGLHEDCASNTASADNIKALLITGGAFHDYDTQTTIITEGIGERINIDWDVVAGGSSDNTKIPLYNDPDWAAGYDVIVHNECSAMVSDNSWINKIIEGHTSQGVPAVAIHCTMHSFGIASTDEWHRFVGVTSPTHEHTMLGINVEKIIVHPITTALTSDWVTPRDELYIIDKVWPEATILATGYGPKTQKDHAVFWTNNYEGIKVFGTSLGHTEQVMRESEWLDTVSQGILWATGSIQ